MPDLDLRKKPVKEAVKEYYASLKQLTLADATNEGNVSHAFAHLLRRSAAQFGWTLIEQYVLPRKGKHPLRIDGAVQTDWAIVHGYWEAKDEHDDLVAEIKKKMVVGYPTDNILYQTPSRILLVQNGQRVFDENITDPTLLGEALKLFFRYRPRAFEEWEQAVDEFRDKVPQLGQALLSLIEKERKENPFFTKAFAQFVEVCRRTLNPSLSEVAVEKMLAQHILTERIFRKVFDNPDFARRNAVASSIEQVIDKLTQRSWNRDKFLAGLDRFYGAIEATASTIADFSEKQHFLNTVYEKFFQGFDAKTADTHGIVYTPQPIVRFMVRSVDEILKKEFGSSLGDKDVHILDPFVGTGNFMLHVMRHIPKSRLPQKYATELHANEVMLLPYYVASMNIEHEYAELVGEYRPFEGLCLVDTFEMAEPQQTSFAAMTEQNAERVEKQRKSPITVIIGNPPYNAWQADENDNNKNRKYPVIDGRVSDTYARDSAATLVNSLSDPYVKAFRWATDRLGDEGVLAYVSNNSYITQVATDGMRRHFEQDFDSIYLVDLGGNVRKNPKLSGTTHNVFGIQVGVSIGLFIRKKRQAGSSRKAEILYARAGETWRKEAKYAYLDAASDLTRLEWTRVEPDTRHTWLTEGLRPEFDTFMPLSGEAAHGREPEAVFNVVSNGLKSQRDTTVYSFSKSAVCANAQRFVSAYRTEQRRWRDAGCPADLDAFASTGALKWSRNLKRQFARGAPLSFSEADVRTAMYRPFTKQHLFFTRVAIDEVGQLFHLFPKPEDTNVSIWLKTGSEWPMFPLAVNSVADLLPQGGSRVLSFHRYGEDATPLDNITDWALEQFRKHYQDPNITKWDVFQFVYAILHHPAYRTRYEANLKRDLPRIPFAPDFWGFAKAGKRLIELHVDYEKQPEWRLGRQENPDLPLDLRVERMKLTKDKKGIAYNDFLVLTGVPEDAFEYRLGNRSALDWIIDQYEVSSSERDGHPNDPNKLDDPEYIIRLIGQVITVSVETVKIVKGLPPLDATATSKQTVDKQPKHADDAERTEPRSKRKVRPS